MNRFKEECMTLNKFSSLLILLLVTGMSACHGGGGGGGNPNAGATITLTPSKTVALADGNDVVTVHADIKNADGTPIADGTPVSFTAPGDNDNPAVTQTTTEDGHASVSLTRDPIQLATRETATVTASSIGLSKSTAIKFINQPAGAEVQIGFNQPVTNLAGLQFNLHSDAGATFDNTAQLITGINAAETTQTLVTGNFISAAHSTKVVLAFAGLSGFNTGTTPVIKATYAITAGLPAFSVDVASASTFTAVGPDFGPTTPPVTAGNLVVTVIYDTDKESAAR
jgi:hypothetical protein